MMKPFSIGIALVSSLMLLQLGSTGARGDINGLYLCMVEFYTVKYEGWKTSNPMIYDMITKDGAITVEQAAKAEARKLVTGQGVIYYKCEGGVFKKLIVEKKGDGGFEMNQVRLPTSSTVRNSAVRMIAGVEMARCMCSPELE